MTKLNFYIVSYNKLYNRISQNLDDESLKLLKAYYVRKSIPKEITLDIDHINEWDLPWNEYSFQKKQYYEYATIIHLTKNIDLIKDLTHIGLLHYDVIFQNNSIDEIISGLNYNANQIFYQCLRGPNDLYFNTNEFLGICNFMSQKLNMIINPRLIIEKGWISEAMSVVPIDVFTRFGNFLIDNHQEIEDILISNRWGIMNSVNHRICGIVERMWGMYLVNCGMELNKMNIVHDWDYYNHHHLQDQNWINK
jgi:hypothetical protein